MRDYYDGFKSGKLHDSTDRLCLDNELKAKSALQDKHTPRRVMNYWLGYLQGMTSRLQGIQ